MLTKEAKQQKEFATNVYRSSDVQLTKANNAPPLSFKEADSHGYRALGVTDCEMRERGHRF